MIIISWAGDQSSPSSAPAQVEFPSFDETLARIRFSVLFAPVVETLLCQVLIIEATKKFTSSASIQIAASALLFGLGHIGRSGQSVAVASFVGIFLAFTYIHWLRKTDSKIKASLAVALTHAIYNFYYVGLYYVPASLFF